MRRGLIISALVASGLGLSVDVRAEVRAITDRNGNYEMTRVLTLHVENHRTVEHRMPGVWSPIGRSTGPQTLNPNGDRLGDLWPTIAEPRVGPRFPWVFWSRLNGAQYDLVWSRWSRPGWGPTAWLGEGLRGDDLDPDVVFDTAGRPYVAWWTDDNGHGTVYVSIFLGSRWMPPLRVSEEKVDASYPRLRIEPDGLSIVYRTPTGRVEHKMQLNHPASITDDIDPLGFGPSGRSSVAVQPERKR